MTSELVLELGTTKGTWIELADGALFLCDLITEEPARGEGSGSSYMTAACEKADAEALTLALIPDSERLQRWYERFGFRPMADPAGGSKPLLVRAPEGFNK